MIREQAHQPAQHRVSIMENLPQGFTPGTDVRLAEADVLVYVGDNQLQPQPGTLFVKLRCVNEG